MNHPTAHHGINPPTPDGLTRPVGHHRGDDGLSGDRPYRPAQPAPGAVPAATARRRLKPKRRFPAEVLSDSEVRRLLDACHPCTTVGKRNRALIFTLYRAGLRIAEALDLRPKDIDFESGSLRILSGKGGRPRTVGIDPAGLTLLAAWLYCEWPCRCRSSPRSSAPSAAARLPRRTSAAR